MRKKENSAQKGVLDIDFGPEKGDENFNEDCFINYVTALKYYPEGNKAISWDLGQAANFVADEDYTTAYDQDIAKSVKFE